MERNHVVKEIVKVKWKFVSDENFHLSNGTIFFDDENDQKLIKLDLKNNNRNLSTKIELLEPSNGYQLGENKVASISFICKFLWKFVQINKKIFKPYDYISACCTMINVALSGDALKYQGLMNGVYHLQSGFSNGQHYWISSEGNAIWYSTDADWSIGYSKSLGTTTAALYVPIKDPSKECPHDNLKSNWRYGTGKGFVEDVNNSVMVQCVPSS